MMIILYRIYGYWLSGYAKTNAPTRLAERYLIVKRALGLKKRLYDFKHTGAGMVIQQGGTI